MFAVNLLITLHQNPFHGAIGMLITLGFWEQKPAVNDKSTSESDAAVLAVVIVREFTLLALSDVIRNNSPGVGNAGIGVVELGTASATSVGDVSGNGTPFLLLGIGAGAGKLLPGSS